MNRPISKVVVRHQALQIRDQMDEHVRHEKSQRICAHLFEVIQSYASDAQILSYVAYRSEPELLHLHERLWENGYRIAIPRVQLATKQLDWRMLYRYDDLEPGYAGIMEPNLALIPWEYDPMKPVVLLMPGLAFDRHGGRLGYGGGYYDRFAEKMGWLKRNTAGVLKVSPVFSDVLVDQVPMDAHDVQLDLIITEQGPIERNV